LLHHVGPVKKVSAGFEKPDSPKFEFNWHPLLFKIKPDGVFDSFKDSSRDFGPLP
jgi:hypothetical protein